MNSFELGTNGVLYVPLVDSLRFTELLYPTGACSDPGNFLAPSLAMAWLGRSDHPQQEHEILGRTPNGASGNLKTRRRAGNFSATDCRELVKNAQAIGDVLWNLFNSALWQTFNQARPQCFRNSQDAQAARQLFCDRLQWC